MIPAHTPILILTALLSCYAVSAFAVSPAAPAAETVSSITAASDSAPVTPASSSEDPVPLELTAGDLITKVYGVLDTSLPAAQVPDEAYSRLHLTPSADSLGLWLETGDGYCVSYYGMMPDVSALARFDNGSLSDFGFFFLFPYGDGERDSANERQCEFCAALLQEMMDIGLAMGVNTLSDALFEAIGSYDGSLVEVRLDEETPVSGNGRFIVMLSVEPGAFSAADDIAAR